MKLTKEQVQAALAAGLYITDVSSEYNIPMKHASGALILNQLLMAIAKGEVSLNTAIQPGNPDPKPDEGVKANDD